MTTPTTTATPTLNEKDTPMTDLNMTTTPTPTPENTMSATNNVTPTTKAKASKAKALKPSKVATLPTQGVAFENDGTVIRFHVSTIALNSADNLTRPEGLDEAHVAVLAEKIATNGQETPVWLTREGEGFRVAAGFHRRAAIGLLHDAGRHDGFIEAKVLADTSVLARATANVTENENGKRDITPLGRVAGYSALIEAGLTIAQVATITGRAEDFVRDHLRLPKGAPECAEALRASEDTNEFVPWGVVRLVLRFAKGQQVDALRLVRGLSVAKAMAALKKLRDVAEEPPAEEPAEGEGEGEGEGAGAKADPLAMLKLLVGETFLPIFDALMDSVRAADEALSTSDVDAAEQAVVMQRKVVQLAQDALVGLIGEGAYNAAVVSVDAKRAALDAEDATDAE